MRQPSPVDELSRSRVKEKISRMVHRIVLHLWSNMNYIRGAGKKRYAFPARLPRRLMPVPIPLQRGFCSGLRIRRTGIDWHRSICLWSGSTGLRCGLVKLTVQPLGTGPGFFRFRQVAIRAGSVIFHEKAAPGAESALEISAAHQLLRDTHSPLQVPRRGGA